MMPARLAPSVCQAKRASSGPCCRSLGHTRNTYGFIPDRSGLDADGEIIGVGVAPPPYTRAAESEGPELRCPTTATIAGSAYSCSATRTAGGRAAVCGPCDRGGSGTPELGPFEIGRAHA